jgi:hypothetical protein
MKQDNFPIDEVDAQTLLVTIRHLHSLPHNLLRRNRGTIQAAFVELGKLVNSVTEGEVTWGVHKGEDTSSQTG